MNEHQSPDVPCRVSGTPCGFVMPTLAPKVFTKRPPDVATDWAPGDRCSPLEVYGRYGSVEDLFRMISRWVGAGWGQRKADQ